MPVESNAKYISDLNVNLPEQGNFLYEADDHTRVIKTCVKGSLPNVSGPITSTHLELSNPILKTVSTAAVDQIPYFTGTTTAAVAPFTAYARTVTACVDAAALRTNLSLDSLYAAKAGGATFTGAVTHTGSLTVSGASPAFALNDTTTSTNRYVKSASGAIGFTNTAGAFVLSVVNDGHATIAGNLNVGGNFYASGTVTGSSDASLKTNVATSQGLNLALQLTGRTFDWISTGNPDRGVIAQEVQAHCPELVHVNPNTGTLTVNYGGLSAILIEAVRDLAKELDAVRHSLTTQMMSLEERLRVLEAN